MQTMLCTALSPGTGILVISGFGVFVVASIFANNRSFRKMSGWEAITRRFRIMTEPLVYERYPDDP